jgi:hypothetical protein
MKWKSDAVKRKWKREYWAWECMIRRCGTPWHKSYPQYGGRGIAVCELWKRSFPAFIAELGPKPDGYSLERIDNNRGYEPGNVRWATQKEQARNRRSNRLLSLGSETKPLIAWAEEYGIHPDTLRNRLRNGVPLSEALTKPLRRVLKRMPA